MAGFAQLKQRIAMRFKEGAAAAKNNLEVLPPKLSQLSEEPAE